jgi:hypothetical protein
MHKETKEPDHLSEDGALNHSVIAHYTNSFIAKHIWVQRYAHKEVNKPEGLPGTACLQYHDCSMRHVYNTMIVQCGLITVLSAVADGWTYRRAVPHNILDMVLSDPVSHFLFFTLHMRPCILWDRWTHSALLKPTTASGSRCVSIWP